MTSRGQNSPPQSPLTVSDLKTLNFEDERNAQEKEQLHGEGKCRETELALRNKEEEELDSNITELKNRIASLEDKMKMEALEKLNALKLYEKEKESRLAAEMSQESLREKLGKAEQEVRDANRRMTLLNEYTTSLEQHNAMLQSDLELAKESLTRARDEIETTMQNLSTIQSRCSSLQEQPTTSRMAELSSIERTEYEQQKRIINDLKDWLQEAEMKLAEGEYVRGF